MVLRKRILKIAILAIILTLIFVSAVPVWADTESPEAEPINGQLQWSTLVGEGVMAQRSSPPAYYDGYLYVVAGNIIYKLNANTGEVVDSQDLGIKVGYATIAPTIADGKVLIGANSSKLIVVDIDNMKNVQVISYQDEEINHQTNCPVIYDNGYAYLGSWLGADTSKPDANGNRVVTDKKGGTYVRINVSTGEVTKLAYDTNGFYWSGACLDNGYALFGSCADGKDDSTPATGNGTLYCVDLTDATTTTAIVDGSMCSAIVEHEGAFYFTTKGGILYKATLEGGQLSVEKLAKMAGPSTCTPVFVDDTIYVGYKVGVLAYDLTSGQTVSYKVPADAKHLAVVGSDILCTYNAAPGGIYNVTGGYDTYVPVKGKRSYCISNIVVVGDMMYYRNDSGYIMALSITHDKVAQSITAKDITKAYASGSFSLGAKARTEMTYESSKPAVATVTSDGQVTIKNTGEAKITITAAESSVFLSGSKTVTITVVPKKVSGLKVTAGSKKLTAKWSRDTKATGYQVLIATNSKFTSGKKTVMISSNKTVSKTIKSLKKGKCYYVKVRAYKSIAGTKKYGAYSTVKKVEVK